MPLVARGAGELGRADLASGGYCRHRHTPGRHPGLLLDQQLVLTASQHLLGQPISERDLDACTLWDQDFAVDHRPTAFLVGGHWPLKTLGTRELDPGRRVDPQE